MKPTDWRTLHTLAHEFKDGRLLRLLELDNTTDALARRWLAWEANGRLGEHPRVWEDDIKLYWQLM